MKSCLVLPGLLLLFAEPAQAQTAEQYNRASQALQICASSTGALIPECAQLRGRMGMSGAGFPAAGLGNLGEGGKAAAIAGLLGQAIAAARSERQAAGPAGPSSASLDVPPPSATAAPNPFGSLLPRR